MTAAHGFKPSFGHAEPRRGTEWWGEAFLVTFGALPKVTRRKGGTHISHHLNNGYVLRKTAIAATPSHSLISVQTHSHRSKNRSRPRIINAARLCGKSNSFSQ